MDFHELENFGSSRISLGFNIFSVSDVSIPLFIVFITSTTSFLCQGSLTDMSIIIENSKATYDSR